MGFQKAINARFPDEVPFVSMKVTANSRGNNSGSSRARSQSGGGRRPGSVRHPRTAGTILETGLAKGPVAVVPSVKRRCRNASLFRVRRTGRWASHQADDLQLLGYWVSHAPSPLSPVMLFFAAGFEHLFGERLLRSRIARRRSLTSPRRPACGVARQPLLTGFQELLRPACTSSRRSLPGGTARQCCPPRAGPPRRSGSSPLPNTACASGAGCRARLPRRRLSNLSIFG